MKKTLTLAEVLIATVFLTVVFSGILMLVINCMLLNEANRNSTVAITHAQYIMEEVRDTSFDFVPGAINSGVWDLDVTKLATEPYNLAILNSELIDTSVATVGSLLEIIVDISWQDRKGRDRSEQLTTWIADYQ